MVDQRAVDYIKTCLSKGFSLEQIKQVLADAGWPQEEINNAVEFANRGNQDDVNKGKSTKKIFLIGLISLIVFCAVLGVFLPPKEVSLTDLQIESISLHTGSGTEIAGRLIKLVSIGENDEITIDVDGLSETIGHLSKKVVNGLEIENIKIENKGIAKIKINVVEPKEAKEINHGLDQEGEPEGELTGEITDCGQSADYSRFLDIEIEAADGGTIATKDYESDSALACFGNRILECKRARVVLDGGNGLRNVEVKGKDGSNCIIRQEFGEMSSEQYKILSNSYVECPIPVEMLPEIAFFGLPPKDQSWMGLPGQTTVGVADAIMLGAMLDQETTCTGSLIDRLREK